MECNDFSALYRERTKALTAPLRRFSLPEGIRSCDVMDLMVEHFGKRMSFSKAADGLQQWTYSRTSELEGQRLTVSRKRQISRSLFGLILEALPGICCLRKMRGQPGT